MITIKAIFIIPGFLGSINEVSSLRDFLIRKGFFVYVCLINGHGNGLNMGNFEAWINQANQDFNRFLNRYDDVVLIGFSLGGVLASICFRSDYRIKRVVLISPAFLHVYFHNIKYGFKALNEFRLNIKNGSKPMSTLKNKRIMYGISELKKLSKYAITNDVLSNIDKPTLLIQGLNDGLVKKENIDYVYNNLKCSKRLITTNGSHNLNNLLTEEILNKILMFIN